MTLQLTPDGTTCWINYVNGSEYPELTEPSELFSLALQSSSRFAPWRKLGAVDPFSEKDPERYRKGTTFG